MTTQWTKAASESNTISKDRAEDSHNIPFVDLKLANGPLVREIADRIHGVIQSASFVLGPEVERFEREFAEFCAVPHCVGVGNGTDAIELSLRAIDIGDGDEVIIPANTFIATAEGVQRSGARVVLADCGDDFLVDMKSVRERITGRTRGVVAVDLYGRVARFDELYSAIPGGVELIEDAAQSQGARYLGRSAGSFGSVAATSFYPGKNLGAFGDGGAIMTSSDKIAGRVRQLRNHGGVGRYEHRIAGANSRLDSIQAAVLSVKLKALRDWNAERVSAAFRYGELLEGMPGLITPSGSPVDDPVWHLYVIRVRERDHVRAEMERAGIEVGIHYPVPIHLLPAFEGLGYGPGDFPVAELLGGEILSLPMFPGITEKQQARVAEVLDCALR